MSQMGQFVQEVQELVFTHFDEPLDTVKEKVRERFSGESPFILNYILKEVEYYYNDLHKNPENPI